MARVDDVGALLARLGFPRDVAGVALQGFGGWRPRYDWDSQLIEAGPELVAGIHARALPSIMLCGANGLGKTLFSAMLVVESVRAGAIEYPWEVQRIYDKTTRDRVLNEARAHGFSKTEQELRGQVQVVMTEIPTSESAVPSMEYREAPYPRLLLVEEFGRSPSEWGFDWWLRTYEALQVFGGCLVFLSNLAPDQLRQVEERLTGSAALRDRLNDGRIFLFTGQSFREWRKSQRGKS